MALANAYSHYPELGVWCPWVGHNGCERQTHFASSESYATRLAVFMGSLPAGTHRLHMTEEQFFMGSLPAGTHRLHMTEELLLHLGANCTSIFNYVNSSSHVLINGNLQYITLLLPNN